MEEGFELQGGRWPEKEAGWQWKRKARCRGPRAVIAPFTVKKPAVPFAQSHTQGYMGSLRLFKSIVLVKGLDVREFGHKVKENRIPINDGMFS